MLLLLLLIAFHYSIFSGDWWFPVYVSTPEPRDARSNLLAYKRANERIDGEQKAYRRMNDYLVTFGSTDDNLDLKLQLEQIRELYNNERVKLFRDKQLIESLEYLFKLSRLDETNDCNENVLETLEHNNHGTEGRAREKWQPKRKYGRPIDAIVHHYFVLHAERCKQVYIDRYGKIKKSDSLEQIEGFFAELINKRLVLSFNHDSPFSNGGEHKFRLETMIGELTNVEPLSMNSGGLILQGLSELLIRNNDVESKNHLDNLLNHRSVENGFKQLIGKYLVEPCRAYVKLYGPKVFELVLFDYKVARQAYVAINQNLVDFYYSWASYKLCKQVSSDGEDKLVEMLLEFCQRRLPK